MDFFGQILPFEFSSNFFGFIFFDLFIFQVNSVAIVEDTGGFSGIIVAAHELGHLLGAVHDGSPPPSYLGGPGAVKCRSVFFWPIIFVLILIYLFLFTIIFFKVGGRVHHERPEAHQQGLQVEHLYSAAVPSLPKVSDISEYTTYRVSKKHSSL